MIFFWKVNYFVVIFLNENFNFVFLDDSGFLHANVKLKSKNNRKKIIFPFIFFFQLIFTPFKKIKIKKIKNLIEKKIFSLKKNFQN